ncbi:hypothetical protein FH972_023228 [Carpinus fangiana]|uniref:Uncharacterized protein n=1 Tax=Carpinus fangiana TaxID=176857 RepID=A0A5N6KUU0_9ROSI|nr:hypothetical protein FH972_023228 [Carpinus fangiana]
MVDGKRGSPVNACSSFAKTTACGLATIPTEEAIAHPWISPLPLFQLSACGAFEHAATRLFAASRDIYWCLRNISGAVGNARHDTAFSGSEPPP